MCGTSGGIEVSSFIAAEAVKRGVETTEKVDKRALSQRNISVEKRAERIQRDLEQNAKDLDARDPRSTVHAELLSYGVGGRYISLVVGRFDEFFVDFVKLRDYIARQRAYVYTEHFNSSVNRAMSMFKLSITSR